MKSISNGTGTYDTFGNTFCTYKISKQKILPRIISDILKIQNSKINPLKLSIILILRLNLNIRFNLKHYLILLL